MWLDLFTAPHENWQLFGLLIKLSKKPYFKVIFVQTGKWGGGAGFLTHTGMTQ